ncbi:MAG TPA: hypothetical protein VME17_22470 [Bryobacteraceae bacterium]|nr:hypothetical protein [Bryobacteraceae bacterium]
MEQHVNGRPRIQGQCGLNKVARVVGTVAGYWHRSTRGDMLADVERLIKDSPERSITAAAVVGLLLGTLIRARS